MLVVNCKFLCTVAWMCIRERVEKYGVVVLLKDFCV